MEKRQNWNGKDKDKMPFHAAASNGLNLFGSFTEQTFSQQARLSSTLPYDAHSILVLG